MREQNAVSRYQVVWVAQQAAVRIKVTKYAIFEERISLRNQWGNIGGCVPSIH